MNEPQIWTIIGVLATALFTMLGLMSGMFTRIIRAEIQGVRAEIGGLRNEMNARLDGLDRDVQFLMKREIDR